MNILIFIQHSEGKILKASISALACAQSLKSAWSKGDIVGLCLGKGADIAADAALEFGLAKVYFSVDSEFDKYRAISFAAAAKEAFSQGSCDTVVAASTSTGKDFMPRLSLVLDAGQASDVVGVNSDGSLKRPMYAGNVFADVQITTAVKIVTVRATAFKPAQKATTVGQKVALNVTFDATKAGEVLSYEGAKSDRPELSDAEIVVSGGRALQSSDNFQKIMFPLADALGAAVGASRAAVDSGYAPNDWQVGQTGKVVAPNLYIAVGISGAIQHLAGMKDSKTIVAINKDPEAPIFEVADFGLVADLFQAAPELATEIKKIKGIA